MKATQKPRITTQNNVDDRINRKRKNELKLGSWNIRTMLQAGKMNEIAAELAKCRMDIVALQEIRWKDSGKISKKEYDLWYSGTENKTGRNGTGFWINANIRRKILGFEPVNDRLCKLRIKGPFNNLTLISAYAPTEDASENEKDRFYTKLEELYNKISKHDTTVILGDFNAKIGNESCNRKVAGMYSLHERTSDNGRRLCNFASSTTTYIASTAFPHKKIHKGTWKIPGSSKVNQIDHALINLRRKSNISDVRSLRGPNCDSDHYLVRIIMRHKLSNVMKVKGAKRKKWNTNKLANLKVKTSFQTEIDKELRRQKTSDSIEEEWKCLKNSITTVADSILGCEIKIKNSEWFDKECKRMIDLKNEARKKWLLKKTRLAEETYIEKRRAATKMCQRKKRDSMKKEIENLCINFNDKQTRKFYSKVKAEKRGFQPRANICKSKNGDILTEEQEIVERWVEYFRELLNAGEIGAFTDINILHANNNTVIYHPDEQPPTIQEILDAVNYMKNFKAPGEDNITAELLKNASTSFIERMHHLTTLIWNNETLPGDWNTAIILPIHKKGDKINCKNYRGISLLNTTYKIFTRIVNKRLIGHSERVLPEYQCGFRPGRSTIDQIFSLKQSMEKCFEHNIGLHMLFIDFKQAFDSINRRAIPTIFYKCKIPDKLTRIVMMTLKETVSKVMIQDKKSDPFRIKTGVRQRDTLSSTIFNLMLCCAIDEVSDAKRTGHILNRTTQLFAYADDIAIVSKNIHALTKTFADIEIAAGKIGLKINEDKTKYMMMSRQKKPTSGKLKIGDFSFEIVESFTYLGFKLSRDNSMSLTIDERILAANRSYASLTKLFKSKLLNRQCKLTLYKTIIRPVLCYGAESWTLIEADKAKLQAFERKVLRRIFGAIKDHGEWRIRWNDELDQLIKGENVIRFIKAQRLRWLGHITRMDGTRAQKKIVEARAFNTRARGRPRTRWTDELEDDINKLRITNWKKVASDRDVWRSHVQQAKAHKEL